MTGKEWRTKLIWSFSEKNEVNLQLSFPKEAGRLSELQSLFSHDVVEMDKNYVKLNGLTFYNGSRYEKLQYDKSPYWKFCELHAKSAISVVL